MARPKKGWRLELDGRSGIYVVRFTHEGRERKLSTGRRDFGEAQEAAARLYAEVVSGRFRPGQGQGIGARPGQKIDELAAEWLDDEATSTRLDTTTIDQYVVYVRRWQAFFTSMDRITPASGEDYWRARLKEIKRRSVLKELSALRTFLGWCKLRGLIAEMPVIASPPKQATGTPTKKPHKGKALVLSEAQIEAVLAELPEMSTRRSRATRALYPVRAVFEVAWETALRPETLASLRAPDDYRKGAERLIIRDEADKARFGRVLPLTPRARAALDRVCPEVGLLFGAHDHRDVLRAAARAAKLPQELAARISPYDFRHSRLTGGQAK